MTGRDRPPEWEREVERPRAVLVGVDRASREWPIDESLAELKQLASTAGLEAIDVVTQRVDTVNPKSFIGSGKIDQVASLVSETSATYVLFDEELTPRQQANLESMVPNVRIVDRTALILEIFASHAHSREGKLQVELATLEYLLPRLRGMWGHLERERLGGGRGTRFGAGESQLETDRRLTRRRIAALKRELERVSATRMTQRKSRATRDVFRIALVGYTNAGKSSLLNRLTGAHTLVYDMLFSTLDSTTRRLTLPDGREVTITDTVGFINKLPHSLIEAFKSTLAEVAEADLLLHVVDASHPLSESHMIATQRVLCDVGASNLPALYVFNKIDRLTSEELHRTAARSPDAVWVSAHTGEGIAELLERIAARLDLTTTLLTLDVPYTRGDIVRIVHTKGCTISQEHTPHGTRIVTRLPHDVARKLREFVADNPSDRNVD